MSTDDIRKKIISVFADRKYYKNRKSKDGDLGCDTACFVIETEKSYEEFRTGADGYYGNYIWYRDNDGFIITLEFDADLFAFEEVKDRLVNVFR